MHWIFVGIAIGIGLMLVPVVIGIGYGVLYIILAAIASPFILIVHYLGELGEFSIWIGERNKAKRLAREAQQQP